MPKRKKSALRRFGANAKRKSTAFFKAILIGLRAILHALGIFLGAVKRSLEALLRALKKFLFQFDKEDLTLLIGLLLVFKGISMKEPWLAYTVTGSVLLSMIFISAARSK